MVFVLRDYQETAVDRAVKSVDIDGADLLVLATGAGKSLVIAEIACRLGREIGILQPNAEILVQNKSKLEHYVSSNEIGVFSASMKQKSIRKYNFAMIGSIYKKPERFYHIGLWIIDEVHLHNIKNTDGMYSRFFNQVNDLRKKAGMTPIKLIGTTATPYRNVLGYHYDDKGQMFATTTLKLLNRMKTGKDGQMFWKRILCNVGIADLIARGYLCPLEYESRTFLTHEEMELNKSGSDFDLEKFDKRIGIKQRQVLDSIFEAEKEHNSVLVFCANVAQAKRFSELVPGSAYVTAKTPDNARFAITNAFKDSRIKTVFNVGCWTTGFDHPELDCIVLLRPTRSLLLYCQMLGRGVRIAKGKSSCKVIDWTDTVNQIGPVEDIELRREQFPEFKYPMWEIFDGKGERWHNRALYSFAVKQKGWQRSVDGQVTKQAPRALRGQPNRRLW